MSKRSVLLTSLLLFGLISLSLAQRGRGTGGGSRRPNQPSLPRGSNTRANANQNDGEAPEGPACTTSNGDSGVCLHLSGCVFQFENIQELERATCKGEDNIDGVCCPTTIPTPNEPIPVSSTSARRRPETVNLPAISKNDIDVSGRRAVQEMSNDIDALERELVQRGLVVQPGSAEAFHQAFFGEKRFAQDVGRDGQVLLTTSKGVSTQFNLNSVQSRDGLRKFNLSDSVVGRSCPRMPRCPPTKYRSFDGSCNNRDNPSWGKSFTAFNRFIEPNFADGVSDPRIASDGGQLPSARAVSVGATPDADIPNQFFTLSIMQWAQFLDHDFSLAAVTRLRTGEGIRCCDPQILANPKLRHPSCFEIQIPKDDRFYSAHGQTCMEFVRSMPAPSPFCTLGPKETLNQLTSVIDGSQIYGSREEEARNLREFKGGRLRTLRFNNVDLLPREANRTEECAQRQAELFCFMAGDERVNEQISLTAMHTIWLREHNRIADILAELNPGWNDEILFQESRRIVAAEIQHISYNEFMPILVGRKTMRKFRLLLKPRGYSDSYDKTVNPTIGNGFSSAAYRYGHTLVQGNVNLIEENGKVAQTVKLHTQFFNPILMYGPGNLDRLLRGLSGQPAQTFDRFVTDQLTNHLFQAPSMKFGLDLVALNIQRGRDNGVPGYNAWREFCGFKKVKTFEELNAYMNPDSVRSFKKNYRSVDDIDLFPAGVAETTLPDATLPPTFACIAAEQFRRLKVGDRFWYENGDQESSFSKNQLKQIRRTSLARIFCDNSDDIKSIQPLIFIRTNKWNPKVMCNSKNIPRMNLGAWRNEPTWA